MRIQQPQDVKIPAKHCVSKFIGRMPKRRAELASSNRSAQTLLCKASRSVQNLYLRRWRHAIALSKLHPSQHGFLRLVRVVQRPQNVIPNM